MQGFLYSILGSIIGVIFASFLTFKVEKALLRQSFKKDIYDQCLAALRLSRQDIHDLDAQIAGFSVIRKSIKAVMKRLDDASTDDEKNAAMQEAERRRASYGNQLRDKIRSSAELVAALHEKVSAYGFALPKTQAAFRKVAEEYGAYLTEQNNFVDSLLSGDAYALFKDGGAWQAQASLSNSLGTTTKHIIDQYDEVESLLRQELVGGLFSIRD